MSNQIKISFNSKVFTADLENNSTSKGLLDLLKNGPISLNFSDYGSQEVLAKLPKNLPNTDKYITAKPGDICVYSSNTLVFYYSDVSWSLSKIGKINGITKNEIKNITGKVTLSL